MADSIRKPWLLNYVLSYAEQHGGQLSSPQPKRGKVQIINFRTLPESPEQWVWADVSDKRHAVPVRFTMESVQAFNNDRRNLGRRLTSRRWGVATVRCMRPFLCRPPTPTGKGLEEKWTLALEVDQIEVAACEGEAMFGEPRDLLREESVLRWVEGLTDQHGAGGNVLKLERLERERKQEECDGDTKRDKDFIQHQQEKDTVFSAGIDSSITENSQGPNARQRLKNWKVMVKEIGLVQAYEFHRIPDDQTQRLNEIMAFGQDSSTKDMTLAKTQSEERNTALERTSGPSDGPVRLNSSFASQPTQQNAISERNSTSKHITGPSDDSMSIDLSATSQPVRFSPQNVVPEHPSTPSEWDASQRTYLGQDQDEGDHGSKGQSPILHEAEHERNNEGIDLRHQVDDPCEHERMPGEKWNEIHENHDAAFTEVEAVQGDKDDEMEVDESPENVRKLELRSVRQLHSSTTSNLSINSAQLQCTIPVAPLPTHEPVVLVPNSSQSSSQSITQSQSLTQPSLTRLFISREPNSPEAELSKPSPNDVVSQFSPPQGPLAAPHVQCEVDFLQVERDIPFAPSSVPVAPNENLHGISHHTDTSTSSSNREKLAGECHIGTKSRRKPLKLGGWLPRIEIPSGSRLITWESFNRMLLRVGQARESKAQRKRPSS